MERLTIPDEKIEGGIRRTVVDTRKVRKNAMSLYWELKKYEDTGLTPEQIREIDRLYAEKCRELAEVKMSTDGFRLMRDCLKMMITFFFLLKIFRFRI